MPHLPISLVLLTSNHWRHHLGATILAQNFNLLGIVSECRRDLQSGKTPDEDKVIKAYDKECAEKEHEYFGDAAAFPLPEEKILRIPYGTCSGEKTIAWIKKFDPAFLILFSASIIHEPMLTLYKDRIINLHLGLTPYYRGYANAFWPLASGEPECLGATVHLVTPELDAGSILGQSRPDDLKEDDGPRDASNKNVISGIHLLTRCIQGYANGTIVPQSQRTDIGKVFRHKDYQAEAIVRLKKNFAIGMMKTYLNHKADRDHGRPIIER